MKGVSCFVIVIGLFVVFSCSSDKKKTPTMTSTRTKKIEKSVKDHPGKIVYLQFCLACHMENGEGVPSLYPPLVQTEFINGDKNLLIQAILHGMEGPIEVKGEKYNNIMAKLDYLRDEQIADVLTYVRSNFGNNAPQVTPIDVRAVRSAGAN